ncbi:polymer-forming cytoskeletal protein [Butyrivibrio sp. MC2021]|uniref:polymer-forming cytoskeletal protein n=1 Tax=Butyrivibrio sp. MC2021 TaxID=1408306 RepID=UPI00047E76CC|nr:polymer-forming cytoskeletal protein [Butyrivibrio sp. MC2021]
MGFFSELKSDLSQAVNTLMPEDTDAETTNPEAEKSEGEKVEEKTEKVDLDTMLNRLDDIKLEDIKGDEPVVQEAVSEPEPEPVEPEPVYEAPKAEPVEPRVEVQTTPEYNEPAPKSALEAISTGHVDAYAAHTPVANENTYNYGGNVAMDFEQQTPTDETAVITEGMVITGDLQTTGSLDLIGKISGNLKCLGKLNVTGEINGDSDAAEIYAESARITGEVRSRGSVKVGQSTVIVGNIYGSSAVIAGAVKGDIDVHGPVVLDTTAIVMGNIKSQSVQINNGAVIEGMCSQAYADVNPSEFFETLKNR